MNRGREQFEQEVKQREQQEMNRVNSIRAEGFLVDARDLMSKLEEQTKILEQGKLEYDKKTNDKLKASFGEAKRSFHLGKDLYAQP